MHIDGARIFNAAVALGVPAAAIARHGDSIGFCVSKGLSAPFGSVLCGSAAFIERARAYRRMVGGGMRQAGVMAAAGIVALERMVDRLADDHRRAKRLAEGLHAIDPRLSDPQLVETNIVMVEIGHTGADAKAWMAALREAGVGCRRLEPQLDPPRHPPPHRRCGGRSGAGDRARGGGGACSAEGKVLERAG